MSCALTMGADWLAVRGDSRGTGWQPDETLMTARTVKSLRLLWKQNLGEPSGPLTDPLLLGPIATHRGIKELVFVRAASGTVYAVDADLGTIFWRRTLEGSSKCGRPVRPAMMQTPKISQNQSTADDDFSDGKKPLYVLAGNGQLHALRSSTGEDVEPPVVFLPRDVFARDLAIDDNVLSAITSSSCESAPDHLWTMRIDGHPASRSLDATSQFVARTFFNWQRRELTAGLLPSGAIELTEAKIGDANDLSGGPHTGRLATWQDPAGTRWIYAAVRDSVAAFQVSESSDHATLSERWSRHGMIAPSPPIVAADVVYVLSTVDGSGSSHLMLHAVDALAGRELYTSGNLITSGSSSGNMAIANGHICFSALDGMLYCFGLPFTL